MNTDNEFLRKALAVRHVLQYFLDQNGTLDGQDALTASFTLDGEDWYPVTRQQKIALMQAAPEDVKRINRGN